MDDVPSLGVIQALEIDTRETIDQTEVAGLREKRVIVEEAPHGDEAVQTTGRLVVAENAVQAHHRCTVIAWGSYLAGS